MSVRSLSVSWEKNSSFPSDATARDRHQSYPSSTAFFSFNTAGSSLGPLCNNHNNSTGDDGRMPSSSSAARFAWLQPWRTPQDCREGGLALLYSMQEILMNVQRARQSSLSEIYVPVRSGANVSATSRCDGLDDSAAASPSPSTTLRLSMRTGSRRRQRQTSDATSPVITAGGEDGGGPLLLGQGRGSSVVSESGFPKGATLMDYMLPGSSTRQTLHMWLDNNTVPQSATTATVTTADSAEEAGSAAAAESDTPHRNICRQRRSSFLDHAEAASTTDAVFSLPAVLHSTPQQPTAAVTTTDQDGNRRDANDDDVLPVVMVDAVPAIPGFEELKAVQEAYQKHQQTTQPPHPRSEAAQRKARALQHSSDDDCDDNDDDHDDTSHDGSPHAHLQATARRAPGADDGTARPTPPPLREKSSSSPHDSRVAVSEEYDDEEEGDVSDHMSATNFGEGGHLACVPGDTLNNRYTLLKALGVGRSSRVWLAADLDQCSLARRQLIRELGEREARRLFRPSERPMFVAIKVFRCSAMYADCATYEAKLSTFVKDSVRLRQLRLLRSPLSRSLPLVVSPTTSSCEGRSRANSTTPLIVSPPQALMTPIGGGGATTTTTTTTVSNASSFAYAGSCSNNHHYNHHTSTSTTNAHPSERLTTFRDAFMVEGEYGTHQCLVMDVLGSGVDKAINETRLAGFPSEVARSIMLSSLQGLAVLAACNVIHTDLKPENLLFTDLEGDVAAEMAAFQSVQLRTGRRSGLWSSLTHRRENVLTYTQRRGREATTASSTAATHTSDHEGNISPHTNEDKDVVVDDAATRGGRASLTRANSPSFKRLSNSDSFHLLAHTRALQADETGRLRGRASFSGEHLHPSRSETPSEEDPQASRHHHHRSRSSGTRSSHDHAVLMGREGSAAGRNGRVSSHLTSPRLRARRPAYEVRVSDFGLSFITPPCLRLGVRAMARYTEDAGITEDELVHDDALSQLQWLYEQQQQQQQPTPRPTGLRAAEHETSNNNSGNARLVEWEVGGAAAATVPAWMAAGELVDEAELRALQLEEAHVDDERVRRKSDATDRVNSETNNAGNDDDTDESGEEIVSEDAPTVAAVCTQPTVPAAEFTSVMDVKAAVEAPERHSVETGRGRGRRSRPQSPQQSTQPDHSHLLPSRSSSHRGSDSTNGDLSSLNDSPVTATDLAGAASTAAVLPRERGAVDHFFAVAPAAPAPPIALRTASYHSPVSHPLTASPSAAHMPSFSRPQSPHIKDVQQEGEGRGLHQIPLPGRPESLTSSSSPTHVTAPSQLSMWSSAVVVDTADNDATPPKPHLRPPPLHLPTWTGPPVKDIAASVTSNDPRTEDARRQMMKSALVSPRRQRRSPASALTSLTALRRLELDIIRSQRYTRGATIQSREYRAPEVLLGNFFLPSCDVWSMGCIAYELVTGRFLIDCIADREHFGRQLAQHLHAAQQQRQGPARNHADSNKEDNEEVVEWDGQPVYVDDDEQDLDVFHLKSIMRLVGPPPLSFLLQRPTGLFVNDYFDQAGNFRFWEEGEAEECGMGLADVYRRQELRYWGNRRQRCNTTSSGTASNTGAASSFTAYLPSNSTNDDYVDDEDGVDEGEGGEKGRHQRPSGSLQRAINDPLDPQLHPLSSSDLPGPRTDTSGAPSVDATPSVLFMTSRSYTNSVISTQMRSGGSTAAVTAAARPTAASVGVNTFVAPPHTIPADTRNYPIETPDWIDVMRLIRQKLDSEEEAQDFERFLRKCLQWDPAQRATAAELLADDWIVKYGDRVAETVDSDAEDDADVAAV
jgi:serine/threonine protein kinase